MSSSLFLDIDQTLQRATPQEAASRLATLLKNKEDFHSLFEALLLQARMQLGLPPILSQSGEELTAEQKTAYEAEVRKAARTVGQLFLEARNIIGAWPYFRMLGEPGPIAQALDQYEPKDDDETFPTILDIAIQEGANPNRGFELLLKRFGICNAITTLGQNFPYTGPVRQQAITRLVDSLYGDLRERLAVHVKELEGSVPPESAGVAELIHDRANLLSEDGYHIDISHLASVIQFALELPASPTSRKVMELCQYGALLSPRLQPSGGSPFDEGYKDYLAYYQALNGINVEEGLAHFRMKAESVAEPKEETAPAEVLVHLLSQLGRPGEALETFSRYLAQAEPRRLACLPPLELARKSGQYAPLAELCLRRGDAVNYLAAKAAAR